MLNQSHGIRQRIIRNAPLVLVVDDNEDNILLACSFLELLSCKHLTAEDGKTAIDIAMDKLPDLILLDIVMPGTDGIAVTQVLKQNPLTNHIPIIAVTGLSFLHQKKQIMDAGCDDYVCKPYLIEELERKLVHFFNLSSIDLCNNNLYNNCDRKLILSA